MKKDDLLRGTCVRLKNQSIHQKAMQEGNHDLFLDNVKQNDPKFDN